MKGLSKTDDLRPGIILPVTGTVAPVRALLSSGNHLGTRPTFVIGVVLVVLGVPFLVTAGNAAETFSGRRRERPPARW